MPPAPPAIETRPMEAPTTSSAVRMRAVMGGLLHRPAAVCLRSAPTERAIVVAAKDAGSVACASTRATEDAGSGREGRSELPAVVREGLVGLRHAEDVVLPLERAPLLGLRVEQL